MIGKLVGIISDVRGCEVGVSSGKDAVDVKPGQMSPVFSIIDVVKREATTAKTIPLNKASNNL